MATLVIILMSMASGASITYLVMKARFEKKKRTYGDVYKWALIDGYEFVSLEEKD